VFLLCTDGLWEYMADAALERTLAAASTPRAWLDALAAEVKAAASHKSSHDNFTALVVWTGAA
jgi:serine/threonine protein phosphatase PrpC